ncbi:MAG: hypothetical protein M1468_01120 [Candidatus Thermoplasmatota archaeon]|jgi:hypothetical protein|nr:hypothetical protein [Candidatus Thermoplasmatota archaeon]MCL5441250.1 hypothetical protein [Candidatus Thermoplasmatota archaeon]
MASDRIAVNFSCEEMKTLQNYRTLYLQSGYDLTEIPPLSEILSGLILETSYMISTNDVRKKVFLNMFLKRRNIPINEVIEEELDVLDDLIGSETSLIDVVPRKKGIYERISEMVINSEDSSVDISSVKCSYNGKYIFSPNGETNTSLEEIYKILSKLVSTLNKEITLPEIVRESVHFIIDNKVRSAVFMAWTYCGMLYGLSPASTLKVMHNYSARTKPKDFKRITSLSEDEKKQLSLVVKDKEIIQRFIKKFDKFGIRDFLKLKALYKREFNEWWSKSADFNFIWGMSGFTVCFFSIYNNIYFLPDLLFYVDKAKWYKVGSVLSREFSALLSEASLLEN